MAKVIGWEGLRKSLEKAYNGRGKLDAIKAGELCTIGFLSIICIITFVLNLVAEEMGVVWQDVWNQ